MFQTIRLPRQSERLAWLEEQIPGLPGHGIIYTLTVHNALRVAEWLQSRRLVVEPYTCQTGDRREELEQSLLDNQVEALVATTALGMGFDKPNLGFVIDYQGPASVVAYYQQAGRAGRALDSAYGVLLSGEEETDIADYFISSALPTPNEVQLVIEALEAVPDGLSVPELMEKVNLSNGRINKTIDLLSLEAPPPFVKEGPQWQLTAAELRDEFWRRASRLTSLRREEQLQMQEYVRLKTGHMEFLIHVLDGEPRMVKPPALPLLPTEVAPNTLREAMAFHRRSSLPIELRRKWPNGVMPRYGVRGRISEALRAEPGRALCIWGDAGWGGIVRSGKFQYGRFSDELVRACYELMVQWGPRPPPEWVVSIPSQRRPDLVPDFAERLAKRMDLPMHRVLEKAENRPEQKTMANSTQQARNLDGLLVVSMKSIPCGPVVLVDDIVDSRWTLTVAAWLLRKHGSGEVWPLVLAVSSQSR